MSKTLVQSFSIMAILAILFSQVSPVPVLAAPLATPAGANGKIAVAKAGDIWLTDSNGSQWFQLTAAAGIEWSPSWSSDGSHLAYVCQSNTGICTIHKDGSNFQLLLTSSQIDSVDWRPGAEQLLYTKAGDLWRIDTDMSNNTQITFTGGDVQSGRYSPDGSKIVYADTGGITVVNADGTSPNILTAVPGDESPTWSPDGTQIVFNRGFAIDNTRDIWIMQASDGSGLGNITNDGLTFDYEATWAADGSKILITRDAGLFMVDPDGSDEALVTNNVVRTPAWQPINVFIVNSPEDHPDETPGDGICETSTPGECTLRAAIQETNALTAIGPLTIELECGLTVTSDLPSFTNTSAEKVIVEGYGYEINGAGAYSLIDVGAGAKVHLEQIILANGLNINGGAIYNASELHLTNTIVKDNTADEGGGIYNVGSLFISNSSFKNNAATTGYGGAIINFGTATIVNSTFNENSAIAGGGAFANRSSANVDFYNVTMVRNQSGAAEGGGYAGLDNSTASLINSLLAGNTGAGPGGGPELSETNFSVTNSSYNLYGSDSLTTADAFDGFTPNGTDLTATSDGTNPTVLASILDTALTVDWATNTAFHRLVYGSPAIDAGDEDTCSEPPVEGLDQRGVTRPTGPECDIGAYESDINIFVVTNTNDDTNPGSLRRAIMDANGAANTTAGKDEIHFTIAGAQPYTISPTSELPAITEALGISGENKVVLYGANAGTGANGLTLNSSSNGIHHLTIKNFDGAGVAVVGVGNTGNLITYNSIYNNNVLDIDLGDDGVSFNHVGVFAGPNNYQNYPLLELATSESGMLRLVGSLESEPTMSFTVDIYKNDACHPTFFGGGKDRIGSFSVFTDGSGLAQFDETLNVGLIEPQAISLTASGIRGTSEFSYCRAVSTPNLNWAQAQAVSSGSSTQQYMTDNFQEKWFKIPVQPGATVHVNLANQPGSAVSLHTDPHLIYDALIEPDDETALSAASANVAFLPSGSLPSGSLPSGSLPSGSLPSESLPSGYLPSGSLPSGSLPSGSLPSGSLPFGALPSGSLPSGSLPSGSLPSGSLPSGSLPSGSLPSGSLPSGSLPSGSLPSGSLPSGSLDAYAMAARRSLIGISMNPLRTEHTIERNTYNYLGDLYVRVVGPYDLSNPFDLDVLVDGGVCNAIAPVPDGLDVGAAPGAGTLKSLLLTDSSRLTGTPPQIAAALAKLQTLAARPEVEGVVIDLADAQYQRVAWANEQADDNLPCPAARNLVAEEIKNVIDAYWDDNAATLEYIVLAGSADVIPYFQVQDVAEIANEKDYIVPVAPQTASEAGLALNLVQGQDGYGSASEFTQAGFKLPFPELAVGRLVDNAADISTAIDAYIATGGVIEPTSSLVTGYDFVGDGAEAVRTELEAGTGTAADTLIQPPGEAPDGPNTWSASDLRALMLANDYDVVALSGHFSAGDLLAADYESQLSALGLSLSSVDLTDTLVLTLGCHGGYTIPKDDLLEGASPNPDWAKAILRKGAAGYIAATGYAYGDTELVEYGERLFVNLTQELRADNGQIAVGQALVEAKRKYLNETTQLTGVDQKTIVEMTLYGLPMMKVDMPGTRLGGGSSSGSIVTSTTPAASGPGADFELSSSSVISLNPDITEHTLQLENLSNPSTQITTTYYTGQNGVVANPFEPIYPKEIHEVQYPGSVLRGVAFRGGTYDDQAGIIPLTTAPATDTTTAHRSFNSNVFYPTQMWMPNYIRAANGGETRLMVFPAQYRSGIPGSISGILRTFTQLDLQFFYLPDSWSNINTRAAAVSAAPSILGASAEENSGDVIFSANVTADGTAGVQSVWVLYTGRFGSPYYGEWLPLDLTQDPDDADTWTGTLTGAAGDPEDILFMVQAVGGAGLTTLDTRNGAFYRTAPEIAPPPAVATTLTFVSPPTTGVYSEETEFTLHLEDSSNSPVADKLITLDIGGQQALAITDSNGDADITLTMQIEPGEYTAQAAFDGDEEYLGSTATNAFSVEKDTVNLSIVSESPNIVAAIKNSSNHQLVGKSVVFVIHNNDHTFVHSVNSNFLGRARLGNLPLPAGVYTVDVYFSGTIPTGSGDDLELTDAYHESASLLDAATLTSIPPDVDITATKADNTPYTAGTWTNQTVTVHFDCSDPDGIASCPADQVFSADGESTAEGTATDMTGNMANASFGPIRIDKTAPIVLSSVRTDANPTNRANVHFTVTFSEVVTGVDVNDFSLVTSKVSGASITSVSGTGATRIITVKTGVKNGTIHLNVLDDNIIQDLGGNALNSAFNTGETYTINKILTFRSTSSQDGWVLESSETSNKGGTINQAATTFQLGDTATNKQYRGILSFNTSSIPDNATITGIMLKVKRQAVVGGGNPVSLFQGFMVDIRKGVFGTPALQITDFHASASKTYGPFSPALSSGWYNINLTSGKTSINKLTTNNGLTQIRLRFKLDDNNNAVANYLSLFSGNAPLPSRPQLVITYVVP